jgi:hypothetical protein
VILHFASSCARRPIAMSIAVLICLLPVAIMAVPTTYYLSPNGDDSNAGTSPAAPWQVVFQ